MTIRNLYAAASGVSGIKSVRLSTAHDVSTATVSIVCSDITCELGDEISVDLGYTDYHSVLFTGYVKQIERAVPDDKYVVTAHDKLIRAMDYFVVADDPEEPLKYHNIAAETLVENLLTLAQLTNFDYQATSFTFAVGAQVFAEVNLTSVYDYCKMVADTIAWHLWYDTDDYVHFKYRKPYVCSGSSGQVGDDTDERPVYGDPGSSAVTILYPSDFTAMDKHVTESETRNRVVIYGAENASAEAESATTLDPWDGAMKQILPVGFTKSAVLASPIIDDQTFMQLSADYNLGLFNRLTYSFRASTLGDPALLARRIVTLYLPQLDITPARNFYIFAAEHNWDENGYITTLELRL